MTIVSSVDLKDTLEFLIFTVVWSTFWIKKNQIFWESDETSRMNRQLNEKHFRRKKKQIAKWKRKKLINEHFVKFWDEKSMHESSFLLFWWIRLKIQIFVYWEIRDLNVEHLSCEIDCFSNVAMSSTKVKSNDNFWYQHQSQDKIKKFSRFQFYFFFIDNEFLNSAFFVVYWRNKQHLILQLFLDIERLRITWSILIYFHWK
jgi:hypothetical protein